MVVQYFNTIEIMVVRGGVHALLSRLSCGGQVGPALVDTRNA